MKETTGGRSRTPDKIDVRDIKSLVKKAEDGDEISRKELEGVMKSFRSSDLYKQLSSITNETSSSLIERVVEVYIQFFNSSHGTNFDDTEQIAEYLKEHGLSEDDGIDFQEIVEATTARPKKYIHPLTKVSDKLFRNEITREGRKVGLNDAKTVQVFVSLNYDKVIEELGESAKIPKLSEDDRQVLDGIVTQLVAGNTVMTYDMIYRGFSGKINDGDIYISEEIYNMIDSALDNFKGWLRIDNKPMIDSGYTKNHLVYEGAILHFERVKKAKINGKGLEGEKTGIIRVLDFPSLYKFAEQNGKEIDTRDIKLLDVPNMKNTRDGLRLKRYLYHRIVIMRRDFETNVLQKRGKMTKSRIIKLSSILEYIGMEIEKSNKGRQAKNKLLKKIDGILDYWIEYGLIKSYEKRKRPGSKEIDSIEIHFIDRKRISDNITQISKE